MKVSPYTTFCVSVCLSVAASCQRTLKSGLESSDWRPRAHAAAAAEGLILKKEKSGKIKWNI